MRPAKNCVVLAAVCLVAACSISPPRASTRGASYQATPCPQPNIAGFPDLDFPSGVQCGYLTVLENRAKPDGRRIRIFVMRAPARLGDAQARSGRVPVGWARRGRLVRGGVHGQARTQRRPRGHLRRPARHAPRRPPPRMSRVGAVHLRRGQPSLRGGIDHRRRRRGDQAVPRPVGRNWRRPRCLQQHGERRRHRRPQGGTGHRHAGTSTGFPTDRGWR